MAKAISLTNVGKYLKKFKSNSQARISMNAATRTDVRKLAMNWESFRAIDHNYSNIVEGASSMPEQIDHWSTPPTGAQPSREDVPAPPNKLWRVGKLIT